MNETAVLTVENLSKHYGGDGPPAVQDVSFDVAPGEFFALLGPSGCGKTSTLRMIAGLIEPTAGIIRINGRSMNEIAPHRRPISMVFQSYALFPHMTVAENVAFGLEMHRVPKQDIQRTVKRSLEMVRMEGYEKRFPRELSGGQQQRVALARAAAVNPAVLLLDEPLGALDRRLRDSMQVELKQLQRELGVAAIMVTHDQDEALTLSDRMAIMENSRIRQIGTPTEIYERPTSSFVANFIGVSNLLDAEVAGRNDGTITLKRRDGQIMEAVDRGDWAPGTAVKVAIRPERIRISSGDGERGEPATVRHRVYLGRLATYHVQLASGPAMVVTEQIQSERSQRFAEGDQVKLLWEPDDVRILHD